MVTAVTPMIGIGPTELLLILLVVILLFGASKLPELARGSGRALRIFKAETKGLMDDDEQPSQDDEPREQRRIEPREDDVRGQATETAREPRPDSER